MVKLPSSLFHIIAIALFSVKNVLLKIVAPSIVKLPSLKMTAFLFLPLKPVITTSHSVTSEFLLIVKKLKSVPFASKTTSPSATIVNFLPEIVKFKLSAPE